MTAQLLVLLLVGLVVVVYTGLALSAWLRTRGTRLVVCPETHESVAVEPDAAHAAISALRDGADIRLKACSRWPERHDCDQGCTAQIAIAPHDTRATVILSRFFTGRSCYACKRTIPPVHTGDQRPGLYDPRTGAIVAWKDIPPAQIPELLAACEPLCANCELIEHFRRAHPDLVTERPPHTEVIQ